MTLEAYDLVIWLFLYFAEIKHIQYVIMINKEGYTKIVNLMITWLGVFVLGCDYIGNIVKRLNFNKNHILSSVGITDLLGNIMNEEFYDLQSLSSGAKG